MNKRRAKVSEIKVWYKFRPSIIIWFSKHKGKTKLCNLPDETCYGGYWFNRGCFAFIQLKYFAIHIALNWWRIKL